MDTLKMLASNAAKTLRQMTLLLAFVAASLAATAQSDTLVSGAGFQAYPQNTGKSLKLFNRNNGGLYDPYAAPDSFAQVNPSYELRVVKVKHNNANTWRVIAGCGAMFIAGGANGLNETISFHYGAFKKRLPNTNDQFWDKKISWQNKYANGNPENGPKFKGADGAFEWTTDAYHLTNMARNTFFIGGAITIGAGPKRPTWKRIAEVGAGMLSYWAGNYFVYDMIFKQ